MSIPFANALDLLDDFVAHLDDVNQEEGQEAAAQQALKAMAAVCYAVGIKNVEIGLGDSVIKITNLTGLLAGASGKMELH